MKVTEWSEEVVEVIRCESPKLGQGVVPLLGQAEAVSLRPLQLIGGTAVKSKKRKCSDSSQTDRARSNDSRRSRAIRIAVASAAVSGSGHHPTIGGLDGARHVARRPTAHSPSHCGHYNE